MSAALEQIVFILKEAEKNFEASLARAEKKKGMVSADFYAGEISGIRMAIDLIEDEIKEPLKKQ